MKNYAVVGLLLSSLLALVPAPAGAAEMKVGVVDLERVTMEYDRYRVSAQSMENRKAELQKVVDEEEKEVLGLIEEFDGLRASATPDEVRKRKREIEERDGELREFVGQTNYQLATDLDSLNVRTRIEIAEISREVAKTLGIQLVLEKSLAIFADDALDITSAVVVELNKRNKPLSEGAGVSSLMKRTGENSPSAPATSFPPAKPSDKKTWPFKQ